MDELDVLQEMTLLNNAEIDSIEQEIGHALPGIYRKLLIEEGFGSFDTREIYDPRRVSEIYEYHFEEPNDLFNCYFPFGCDNDTQVLWIVSVERDRAAAIWHETHPEDYVDEEWLPYEDWIAKYLDRAST